MDREGTLAALISTADLHRRLGELRGAHVRRALQIDRMRAKIVGQSAAAFYDELRLRRDPLTIGDVFIVALTNGAVAGDDDFARLQAEQVEVEVAIVQIEGELAARDAAASEAPKPTGAIV